MPAPSSLPESPLGQLSLNQQPIKGLLFDLDGTLLDTAADLGAAANVLLARDNLPLLNQQVIFQTASQGALALIKSGYGNQLSLEESSLLRAQFLDNYLQNINCHTHYFAGVEQMLHTLNQANIPWGIVTNKPYIYTKALLQHYPLLRTAQVTVCGDSMAVRNPHPQPLLVAANSLAVAPAAVAYVGDALTDIEAANSANMHSVAAAYGYISNGDNVANWHANLLIANCNELLTVLTNH